MSPAQGILLLKDRMASHPESLRLAIRFVARTARRAWQTSTRQNRTYKSFLTETAVSPRFLGAVHPIDTYLGPSFGELRNTCLSVRKRCSKLLVSMLLADNFLPISS